MTDRVFTDEEIDFLVSIVAMYVTVITAKVDYGMLDSADAQDLILLAASITRKLEEMRDDA